MENAAKKEREGERRRKGERGINANNEKFQAVFKCFIGFLIMFAHQRGPHMRNKRPPAAAKLKLKLKSKLEHSFLDCHCGSLGSTKLRAEAKGRNKSSSDMSQALCVCLA